MRLGYAKTLNPFTGIAESGGTSNSIFLGDAVAVTWSLTTSSATASRWTLQGSNSGGFTASVEASSWQNILGVTAQGFYSVDTIPRWARFQRTVSNSSSTVLLGFHVRP